MMISVIEQEQDVVAERGFAEREQELDRSRREIASRVRKCNERAKHLRQRLAKLDPKSEAVAELTSKLEDLQQDVRRYRYDLYVLIAEALATVNEDGSHEHRYTAADVESWCDRAVDMGCSTPRLDAALVKDLSRMRQVPNAPFRERLSAVLDVRTMDEVVLAVWDELRLLEERDGVEHGSKHLVMANADGEPSAQHRQAERLLGLEGRPAKGLPSLRLFITYEQGLAFMRALDMTPKQAGL